MPSVPNSDLLCLSHLRWDFVYQRPNHLMARASRDRRVIFVEEPMHGEGPARLDVDVRDRVLVVRPRLPEGLDAADRDATLGSLVGKLLTDEGVRRPWLWYYTPMALGWTRSIEASAVVYDCMDDLAGFRGAPAELVDLERELMARADTVFTGGRSLYEAKVRQHGNIHAVPSAVDVKHFARARQPGPEPEDQAAIGRPRIGYYGVIDERVDRQLILDVARLRPEWQVILVGPVAKLAPDEIPSAPNLHLLGMKSYDQLPDYLRGWDVAIMPFALNDATRFISPTKTPEYLAGGRPVVSTPIRDVVEPYGRLNLVRIADTAPAFVAAVEAAMHDDMPALLARADRTLAEMSWDASWTRMDGLVKASLVEPAPSRALTPEVLAGPRLEPRTVGVPVGARHTIGAQLERAGVRAGRPDDELAGVR